MRARVPIRRRRSAPAEANGACCTSASHWQGPCDVADVPSIPTMHLAPTLLARALDRARADWLAGDPSAWARYTDGLARLEEHYRRKEARDGGAVPRSTRDHPRVRPPRPTDRPAARF
jgi:hypothetical protein